MPRDPSSLEETVIAELIHTKKPVLINLRNGIQLQGMITALNNGTIFLKKTFVQMLYLHRISQIKPVKPGIREPVF